MEGEKCMKQKKRVSLLTILLVFSLFMSGCVGGTRGEEVPQADQAKIIEAAKAEEDE